MNSPGPVAEALGALGHAENLAARQAVGRRLRDALSAMPAAKAVAEIQAFLAMGRDESTGETFRVGRNGMIVSSPTLRTLLLDLLGRLDAKAAATQAMSLLETPTTADEWAVALRNLSWGSDPAETRDLLRSKTLELIENPVWRTAPSAGYFEAFDALVHTRAADTVPLLARMTLDPTRRDLAYAAFLTLDRLTIREPEAVLSALVESPSLSARRPEMVAGLFARGDVGVPAQRKALEAYLLSPARSDAEWKAFASLYPNANALVSQNLLTSAADTTPPALAQRDRSALAWTEALLKDDRFTRHAAELKLLRQRLTQMAGPGNP